MPGLRRLTHRLTAAALAVAVAFVFCLALWPGLQGAAPLFVFLPAIVVAGHLSGRLGGLLAAALLALAFGFVFPPAPDPSNPQSTLGAIVFFFILGGILALLAGSMWARRIDALDRADEARRSRDQFE